MDVGEQKYRKIINDYKPQISNVLNEYPLKFRNLPTYRNLKYILNKQAMTMNIPQNHALYEETIYDIKQQINDKNLQTRLLAVRLARALPLVHRINFIEESENQLTKLASKVNKTSTNQQQVDTNYNYEFAVDVADLLLSVYQLTHLCEEVFSDTNQRVVGIMARIIENLLCNEPCTIRNSLEILRQIFIVLGSQTPSNRLIVKIINLLKNSNQQPTKDFYRIPTTSKFLTLVFKCKIFQLRLQSRLIYGICCLLNYDWEPQVAQCVIYHLQVILQNTSQCDVNIDCFSCIRVLLRLPNLGYQSRVQLLKHAAQKLHELTFKKQYFEFYLQIIQQCCKQAPLKLRYWVSVDYLQITRTLQQQFSRFKLYNLQCLCLMGIARECIKLKQKLDIIISMLQYDWFIARINQQNHLFSAEYLISLIEAFFQGTEEEYGIQSADLLVMCHKLIDWQFKCKQQSNIPTVKFAFDMYLSFLKKVSSILGPGINEYIVELVIRCNQQNIAFSFKLKLITTLMQLQYYQQYKKSNYPQLDLKFIEGQINPFMMPKEHKLIFQYDYSLSLDGEIQSQKQLECVIYIMLMFDELSSAHEEIASTISSITIKYHGYLEDLKQKPKANLILINNLRSQKNQQLLQECHRNFLLSLIQNDQDNNNELNIYNNITYSPYQTIQNNDINDINIFGIMSPIQLSVKITCNPHCYSSVYLYIKYNRWITIENTLILKISSMVQVQELNLTSTLIQIKIDISGQLNFQLWNGLQLLGSNRYTIKRKLIWKQMNHLSILNGIHSQFYYENIKLPSSTYLSYFFGQPVLVQLNRIKNDIVLLATSSIRYNYLYSMLKDIVKSIDEMYQIKSI